ncbi:hypothetical protein CAEBREN_19330 [Caenorhabditis brenneri]|uniref:Uncharacterized protein n=1 Tax=Caenorhabditis brenneri TaxID=135651 RepID=G0MRE7_CAEBE|nr:hypothetical protein CAEBREN_19330 [Caenorhabditis brenneri]
MFFPELRQNIKVVFGKGFHSITVSRACRTINLAVGNNSDTKSGEESNTSNCS